METETTTTDQQPSISMILLTEQPISSLPVAVPVEEVALKQSSSGSDNGLLGATAPLLPSSNYHAQMTVPASGLERVSSVCVLGPDENGHGSQSDVRPRYSNSEGYSQAIASIQTGTLFNAGPVDPSRNLISSVLEERSEEETASVRSQTSSTANEHQPSPNYTTENKPATATGEESPRTRNLDKFRAQASKRTPLAQSIVAETQVAVPAAHTPAAVQMMAQRQRMTRKKSPSNAANYRQGIKRSHDLLFEGDAMVPMRRAMSMGSLPPRPQAAQSSSETVDKAYVKSIDILQAQSVFNVSVEARSRFPQQSKQHRAAVAIQRFYRFYRMRVHFSSIVQSVLSNPCLSMEVNNTPVVETAPPPTTTTAAVEPDEAWTRAQILKAEATQTTELTSLDSIADDTQSKADGSTTDLISPTTSNITTSPLSPTEKLLRKHINEFNMEPNKAIKNLIKQEALADNPDAIAYFLIHEHRLSKTKIGEYLGIGEDIHNKVLRSFVNQLDFTNLSFDDALRKLLLTFRLPGEAQKIDRIMNEFARRFCSNNPTVFSSPDTAYILAYSLIMLNTDAHNPNVKKKMSLTDFLRNNRGIDNKNDLPEEFMRQLYFNIVNNEIKMNQCDNVHKVRELLLQISGLPEKAEVCENTLHQTVFIDAL
jgi:hypothetical protein